MKTSQYHWDGPSRHTPCTLFFSQGAWYTCFFPVSKQANILAMYKIPPNHVLIYLLIVILYHTSQIFISLFSLLSLSPLSIFLSPPPFTINKTEQNPPPTCHLPLMSSLYCPLPFDLVSFHFSFKSHLRPASIWTSYRCPCSPFPSLVLASALVYSYSP